MSRVSPPDVSPAARRFPWLHAFWKFARPHTVIGTSLSAIGLAVMALG